MPLFTSTREKRLWFYALLVWLAIFATLFLSRPLIRVFADQNLQAAIFLLGMLLIGATMVVHGLKTRPGRKEIAVWLGLSAVYLMFFLRLGLPERSHLIEYSVLAIFIHRALMERFKPTPQVLRPAIIAFLLTVLIGILDESIQKLLPNRVFDPLDMLFNGLAGFMAIGARLILRWIQNRFRQVK